MEKKGFIRVRVLQEKEIKEGISILTPEYTVPKVSKIDLKNKIVVCTDDNVYHFKNLRTLYVEIDFSGKVKEIPLAFYHWNYVLGNNLVDNNTQVTVLCKTRIGEDKTYSEFAKILIVKNEDYYRDIIMKEGVWEGVNKLMLDVKEGKNQCHWNSILKEYLKPVC